ncbi:hypothetical protein GGX14DRAFT_570243 [Mycena pura]|uniref:Uncharacterized protein n=1 Tax=Mycena pura TaxID=153505 RepID=A0AAD6V5Z3_9AGAR|nr:hypothetical protein GGX14DRAFT_570243 [Mycena pura]
MSSAKALLAKGRAAAAARALQAESDPLSTPLTPLATPVFHPSSFSEQGDDGFESSPAPSIFSVRSGTSASTNMPQLKSAAERALKRIKVSNETAAEFRRWSETANRDERDAMTTLWVLNTNEKLDKFMVAKTEDYKPSDALVKIIRKYGWALVLLSNIHYYAGTLEDAIIAAMRESDVKELPEEDSLEHSELVKFIGGELTTIKYITKKAVIDSLEKKSDIRNIAKLTEALLHHAKQVPVTFGLYMRIAFMRHHVLQNHPNKSFWYKLDDDLQDLRKETPEDFIAALRYVYDEDVKQFGDPQVTGITTGDPIGEKSPKWLRNLTREAARIVRAVKKQGKRKRAAESDGEIDEGTADGADGGSGRDEQPESDNQSLLD